MWRWFYACSLKFVFKVIVFWLLFFEIRDGAVSEGGEVAEGRVIG